jgi:hypothetical protein
MGCDMEYGGLQHFLDMDILRRMGYTTAIHELSISPAFLIFAISLSIYHSEHNIVSAQD